MNVMSLIIPYFPPPLFVLQRFKHLKPSRMGPQTQNFVKQFHATNTSGVTRICSDLKLTMEFAFCVAVDGDI